MHINNTIIIIIIEVTEHVFVKLNYGYYTSFISSVESGLLFTFLSLGIICVRDLMLFNSVLEGKTFFLYAS